MFTLFIFSKGGNPYIAKTEKEAKRIKTKYKSKITKYKNNMYFINN